MIFFQKVKGGFTPFLQNSIKILIFLAVMNFFGFGIVWGDAVWKDVSSKEDQFTVSMPGDAKFKSEDVKTKLGPIEAHEWLVETDNGATAFLTMINQYPPSHVAKVGAAGLLDGAQKGGLGTEGKLRTQKEIQVEGNPGREIVFEKNGNVIFIRFFLVKNRLYQLIVATAPSKESTVATDSQKFFNSFKLL